MKLNLTRPLAFFDLETTGTNIASDRIIEIAILKIHPNGNKEEFLKLINPEMPIPPSASAIHGITDDKVKNEPTFKELAPAINNFLKGCDLAGYNSNKFDIPILVEEFLRAGIDFDIKNRKFVDVQNIFHLMEQRTLKAAYKFYCGKELKNAHSAIADIYATYEVFLSQLERYEGVEIEDKNGNKFVPIKNDINVLHELNYTNKNVDLAGRIIYNENGIEVFNFGKHAGKPVEEVFKTEPSYYDWMMKGDFPLYTKKVITAIKLRSANTKTV
jgi:DNA polymerase-3 subunit epsilon